MLKQLRYILFTPKKLQGAVLLRSFNYHPTR